MLAAAVMLFLMNYILPFVAQKSGPEYDSIVDGALIFAPDGNGLAYEAQDGDKKVVVLGGEPGPEYDDIYLDLYQPTTIFSPDGKRMAYLGERDKKSYIVINSQVVAEYDGVFESISDPIIFSPDSKHLAYQSLHWDKQSVVKDGQNGAEYDSIAQLTFSPDGNHLAYVANKSKKPLVVVDGRDGPEFDGSIGLWKFSPDNKHLAFEVTIGIGGPDFPWESLKLPYKPVEGVKEFVGVDGQVGPQYDRIFSNHMRDQAFSPDGVLEFLAVKEGSLYRVEYIPLK